MKRYFLTLILILATSVNLTAAQRLEIKEQTTKIADAIAKPLYGYDLGSVDPIIESKVENFDTVRGIDIFDANSEEVIFERLKSDDNKRFLNESIPETVKSEFQQIIVPITYENEILGQLRVYYRESLASPIGLTPEEIAWIKAHPVLRVSNELDWPPFNFVRDGVSLGYSIDFMNRVAQKVGLEVEYIAGPSWNDFLNMMKKGELDVMLNIVKTPERQKYMLYTPPYGNNPNVILSRREALFNNLEALSGKTVAIPKGFWYEEIIKRDYPQINILAVKNTLECLKAVSFNKADAAFGELAVFNYLISEHMMTDLVISDEVKMGNSEFSLLNMSTRKDLPLLASIITKGINAVSPEERKNIQLRWLANPEDAKQKPAKTKILLTDSERDWLGSQSKIRFGVDPAWPPFDYIDGQGQHQGMAADILRLLADRLEIEMSLVPNLSWPQVLKRAQSRTIDIIPCLSQTPERSNYLKFTQPFTYIPWVIVTRKDFKPIESLPDLTNDRVTMVDGYAIIDLTRQVYPEFKIQSVKSPLEGLKAVSLNEMDAYVGNLGVISHLIQKNNLNNLKIASGTGFDDQQLRIGVRSDWPEMVSILNKGLASISMEEMNTIQKKWIPLHHDLTKTAEQDSPTYFNILIIGIIACGLIMVMLFLYLRQARGEKKALLTLLILMFICLVCAEIITIKLYLTKKTAISNAKLVRLESIRTIDHIRNISGELTRMARTFVATSESRFEKYFNQILLIREGKAPRPLSYYDIYWDHVVATGRAPRGDGSPISLETILRKMKFSEEEFNLLRKAEVKSNILAELEHRAMNMAKGIYEDESGAYTRKGSPDTIRAMKLLHGKQYHQSKNEIMEMIGIAGKLVNRRTEKIITKLEFEVRELQFVTFFLSIGVLVLIAVLIFIAFRWMISLQKIVSTSVPDGAEKISIENRKQIIISSLVKSWPLVAATVLVSCLISGLSWRNQMHLVANERAALKESLKVTLQTTNDSAKLWLEDREQEVRIWASTTQLGKIFTMLSSTDEMQGQDTSNDLLINSQAELLGFLTPIISNKGYLGYLMVNYKGKILGSDRGELIGSYLDSPLERQFLESSMSGPNFSAISLPAKWQKAGVTLHQRAVMMTGALVKPVHGDTPGVLIFLIDPEKQFTEILQRGRLGESGETYAFDQTGRLISESRFDNNLRDIGLIGPTERGILNISIRDPGGNMLAGFAPKTDRNQLPLTLMAAQATRGGSGYNIDGYSDYRGVPVVGSWLWNQSLGFGVTTEMDVPEAYQAINNIRRQTWVTILISTVLLAGLTAIFIWGRIRTSFANEKLRLSERQITEQFAYQSALLDAIPNPIFVKGTDTAFTACNKAYEIMFGVSRKDFIGKTIMELDHFPENTRKSFQEADETLLVTKGFEREEISIEDADGNPRSMMYWRQTFDLLDGDSGSLIGILIDITERKLAEDAMAEAEERSRLLLESVGDGIFGVGDDGLVNFINSAGLDMLGFQLEEVVGQKIHPLIHHTKADGSYYPIDDCPMYRSSTQGISHQVYDEVLWRKDGTSFPVEYSSVPVMKREDLVGSVVVFRDITLRKQQEEELKKLSSAVEQSMVSVVITDPKGTIEYVNSAFLEITGYTQEETIGKNPRFLNAGIQSKEFYRTMWKTISKGNVWQGEFANKKKNGDIFWENAVISPIRDDQDKITHYVAVKDDISARKIAEEALKENEEMLSKITSSALSAIIMISSETGKISFWNLSAERIFGWKAEEVIGKKLHHLIIPEQYRQDHIKNLAEFSKTGKGSIIGHSTELMALKRNGEEFSIELHLSSVKLQNQWHAIGLITDITDRKQVEIELQEAKEAAEVATRAKSDFLANMSHEIRTPMNAIIGMSHLCLGTDLAPRQKDYVEKVYASAQSLLGIINDILDFSKIEAGKLEIESIPFRLDEVLDNLGNVIALKAQEKGLELLFDTHPDVPKALLGDPLRLGQILLNLAGNAVKFTEEGEIVIRTEPIKITDEKAEVRIMVKDSGIGMTPEQIDKLFQSFSQADTSTTRKYGGTGLGLTISKKLTEMMNGNIWVESEPGKGSAFIFTVVFGRAMEMEDSIEKQRPADLDQLNVLVVDDIKSARQMIAATLESFSFRVTCVDSGQAALAALEAAPVDDPFQLVLMDWRMPGMDGIEASKRIKAHPALPEIPTVIMVTAYGREEVMHQAEKVGLEGFLIKPMTPSTLLDTIMQVFGDKGGLRMGGSSGKEWEIKAISSIEGCHVLVAEDNKINQQVAEELLSQAGLIVCIANNGKEAVELAGKETFDAVLMDMQMPEMDGFEATRVLRSKSEFKELPIIAMTANAMAGDREKCLDAGMNDHVPKPIDPDQLFSTLVQWIEPSRTKEVPPTVTSQAKKDDPELLPDLLAGIDTEKGLKSVGGNRTLYRKLLVDFYQDHQNDINGIRTAIQDGEIDVAQRIAHTIKGVTGAIGAAGLFKASERMDAALKQNDSDKYNDLLAAMEPEMGVVMSAIKNLVPNEGRQEKLQESYDTSGQSDMATVIDALEVLEALVEEMDPDSEEKVIELSAALKGTRHGLLAEKLVRQVEEFEFDEASQTISLLKKAMKEAD